ncbi:OX-2 membrane glycoprotein-like [Dicentrarchus labrax]|uniref:Ig-like domain-containing protein n=1 Tax=Dicentrarchus labrax TaxID=13489 RepID=A0A8P4K9X2_DICLA|nr:OX-2 membrane glycoprotein-like [Dicentrarchus labrax]
MNNAAEMSHRAVIHVLCVLGVFQKGLTALVQTQQTVMAAVGEEAHLNCQLMQNKDVVQVTWWKPEGEKTLATSSKPFGPRVNPDFIDKVEFKDAGLQNNSIVIRNLTEQDEGCYHCLFNSYPDGALTAITCIKLYELHEPILHVRESNSPEEAVVSCSATARPAPTVTLRVLQQDFHFSNYSSVNVTNTNGTVAVTTTTVLSGFRGNNTQVGCAARVLSGPQIEVFMMIPEVKQSSADGFDDESGSKDRDLYWISIIVFSVVGVFGHIAAFLYFLVKHKNQNRFFSQPKSESQSLRADECCSDLTAAASSNLSHGDTEMNETTTNDTQKAEASSVTQESDGVRQRPSPVKTEPSDNLNPSPSTSVQL